MHTLIDHTMQAIRIVLMACLALLFASGVALGAHTALDATIGRTHRDCIVTDKRVEQWTPQGNSPWLIATSCGSFDVGSESQWSAVEPGQSYTIASTVRPLGSLRTAHSLTDTVVG